VSKYDDLIGQFSARFYPASQRRSGDYKDFPGFVAEMHYFAILDGGHYV